MPGKYGIIVQQIENQDIKGISVVKSFSSELPSQSKFWGTHSGLNLLDQIYILLNKSLYLRSDPIGGLKFLWDSKKTNYLTFRSKVYDCEIFIISLERRQDILVWQARNSNRQVVGQNINQRQATNAKNIFWVQRWLLTL
jgi:hypothetical protein